MADAPLSETMRELLTRGDRVAKEAERARVAWRAQRDKVSDMKKSYKVELRKAVARLVGEGDAQYRKVVAEAEVAQMKYELELAQSLAGSMYAAWEERLAEMDLLKSAFNAYNRELRELGG